MTTLHPFRARLASAFVVVLLWISGGMMLHAQPATGTIEGRISNPSGGYLERARVTVEGTSLETFTDSDGNYRLTNVPPGSARVAAFFTGLQLQTNPVNVIAGQTVQLDFRLSTSATPAADGAPIKLDEFVVGASREMSGAALAINEQRFAPNMKNVVSADEFGDVAEGNVAEFLKFLPGVNIDYAGGNAREVSLNGVPADNVPVTIDGFSVASAVGGGAGGTNRAVGLDQISINNLSRIEVSFSPTPESQGAALAGSVNMVPRSSFERAKPVFNFSTYFMMRDNAKDWDKTPAPRKPTRKIHPGMDFSYLAPVNDRFGYTLSGGFNRQYSGEPQSQNTWRGTQAATNGAAFPHTSFDQPYLSAYLVRNSGKETKRSSFGATVDYKLTRNDRLTFGFQFSTFDVLINHNALTFDVVRVLPGQFTTTSTRGATGAGDIELVTMGNSRTNWTYMPSLVWRHDGPIWKGEAGASFSRAQNRQRNIEGGFFATTTARRTGVTVSFDDIFYLRPRVINVTDAAGAPVDPYSLSTYNVVSAGDNERSTDDTQRTAYANVRRDFYGRLPFSLKTGVDFRQGVRDQRAGVPTYNFVGADGRASTVPTGNDDSAAPFIDPSFSSRVAPYGFPPIGGISSEKLYEHFVANPSHFTANANNNYRSPINLSKRAQELISSVYVRGDLHLLDRRLKLVGGVRAEQTNIEAEGPLTDPTLNFQRNAQGQPILGANGRPLLITNDALQTSVLTFIDRGAKAEKEYLRLFPSLNASYNIRDNLIARAAVYNSVGRPDFNQYAGGLTLPDTEVAPASNNRIVVSNVGIKAWSARTFNARLEYYFEGVGQISIGGFRRDFENFFGATTFNATPEFLALYSLDPALYGEYEVATQHNIESTVRTQGLNVNYKQALTFLPSWARGVQIFANGSAQRLLGPASTNFPGFIPRSASWGFNLARKNYNLRANWNYRGHQRRAPIAAGASIEPGTYTWWSKRLYLDVSGEYYFWKRFAVFANLRNVGDSPDDVQVYGPSTPEHAQFRQRIAFGSLWMFGIKGTF
jgi:iron complex outermembrane recepter protein